MISYVLTFLGGAAFGGALVAGAMWATLRPALELARIRAETAEQKVKLWSIKVELD